MGYFSEPCNASELPGTTDGGRFTENRAAAKPKQLIYRSPFLSFFLFSFLPVWVQLCFIIFLVK
jgi:hypothetical protein